MPGCTELPPHACYSYWQQCDAMGQEAKLECSEGPRGPTLSLETLCNLQTLSFQPLSCYLLPNSPHSITLHSSSCITQCSPFSVSFPRPVLTSAGKSFSLTQVSLLSSAVCPGQGKKKNIYIQGSCLDRA